MSISKLKNQTSSHENRQSHHNFHISNLKQNNFNPVKILNSTVNMVDIPFITKWISNQIDQYGNSSNSSKQLIVTGFHGLNQARIDPNYFRIGQECDLWVPDSIAPVLIAKNRGMKNVVRTPGAEIMKAFLESANKRGFKSYFYGDSDSTLSALRNNLEKQYPGHKVVGTFSPPFRPLSLEEEQSHIDMINDAKPDILWVGLGLPKQDEWIYRCKDRLKVPVAAGVGAAFGFLAGTVQRAPDWMCRLRLEWAYMVVKKPRRTGKRVFIDGSKFLWHVLAEEMGGSKENVLNIK